MLLIPEDASKEYLAQELKSAEKALEESLRSKERREQAQNDHSPRSSGREQQLPKSALLAHLSETAASLALAQAMTEWMSQAPTNTDEDSSAHLIAQAEWCDRLSRILVDHSERTPSGSLVKLYEDTYLPIYNYLFPSVMGVLRRELEASQYPKKKGSCAALVRHCQTSPDSSAFGQACYWIFKLQRSHKLLLQALDLTERQSMSGNLTASMILVREFLRPFLRRIRFHFVESSPDRATTTRIDKLPEWLLNYTRENILEAVDHDCPHDVIHLGLSCVLSSEDAVQLGICFWLELVRLLQWVLSERQFFRHPDIVGPRSNPVHLYNAMEQLLLFDRTLREQAPIGNDDNVLLGLMDTLVMADDELRQWWIDRERETVFTILFEDNSMADVPKPLANHVSPRTEIFCSLIRSVQWKASILTEPGIYLRNVAVPLCSQFVDALHETSVDLRNLLCQPMATGTAEALSHLGANLHEWVEIINGTNLAANVLLREGAWQDGMPATSQSDQDLARFGRSLERLVDVLVEEMASTFVETVLMEQSKFASYIMMASHLLASQEWDADDGDLSAELKETRAVLSVMHQVCESILSEGGEDDGPSGSSSRTSPSDQQIAHFAPRAIQVLVMTRVADKLLEVVLDIHDTTPSLRLEGSMVFARDVDLIVGAFSDIPLVQRLLDINQLAVMDANAAEGLLAALGGLVGKTEFLDIHDFSSDETAYDEAIMMLKAKGLTRLELKDAISILKRRQH